MFNSTKEIKKLIADHERMAAELKEMLAKKEAEESGQNKIPDDVRDIPTTYPVEAYSRGDRGNRTVDSFGFYADSPDDILGFTLGDTESGTVSYWYDPTSNKECLDNHFTFPTENLAKMFREKAQLIADCIFFKWFYDRWFVPVWNGCNDNWLVVYDEREKCYVVGCYNNLRHNMVYFSSEEMAQKCAEWLNYKYKKGEYSEAHD